MEKENMIQTALAAAQKPFFDIQSTGTPILLIPQANGEWKTEDITEYLNRPPRKYGNKCLHDTESLIKYVKKHKQPGTEIYINAGLQDGHINVIAVLNGHTAETAEWEDYTAQFTPAHTPSASRWLRNSNSRMNQAEFSAFLTNCSRDIVAKNPENDSISYPSAAEVMDFALNLEYTEKTTFKHGYREQDGRINFTFQSEDAGKTETNLKAFERFGIAFTPYQGGDSYFVEALLKFRIDKNTGMLVLWYELQQIDAVIERATRDISETLQTNLTDVDIYFGKP